MTTCLPTVTDDLSWVTFSDDEHAEACYGKGCDAQATYVAIYRALSNCPHVRWLYCLAHRDLVWRMANKYNVFLCPRCKDAGLDDAILILIRMERL